jgi:hypothetical protein
MPSYSILPYGVSRPRPARQALWEQHRKLPLALKDMRDTLRRGAQAAYEAGTPASRRLAKELHSAVWPQRRAGGCGWGSALGP